MDTFEILTSIQNRTGLKEREIGHRVLLRFANEGHNYVTEEMYDLVKGHMISEKSYVSQTGTDVLLPENVFRLIDVKRETADGTGIMKRANPVDPKFRDLVAAGRPNFEASTEKPLYIHEGGLVHIYPTMPKNDVEIRYYRKQVELLDGKVTYHSASEGDLPQEAMPFSDHYNNQLFSLYEIEGEDMKLKGVYLVKDYTGTSRRVLTDDYTFDNTKLQVFALIPFMPVQFHTLIVDAAVAEIMRAGLVEGDWAKEQARLDARIQKALARHGGAE